MAGMPRGGRRPDRHGTREARVSGRTVAAVVLAGVALVLLVVFMELFLDRWSRTVPDAPPAIPGLPDRRR